ncbi:MAG TPA: NADP-dependent oxidoreductase [Opitutaceae bacterium]|nr:NADP-dependent oxidoreductase [Opitutaceae bacterium]
MKAIRMHTFGGPDVLRLENLPKPEPRDGEVLIRVRAASVNPVDYKMRSGSFKPEGMRTPLTLGRDVSGVVEGIGRGVDDIRAGDEVYALLDRDHGGYAEYAIASAHGTASKPDSIDHVHAAAVPLAATTAWQGLFDHGKLQTGERVLIHGAAGGVGHFAVQFAKDRGAYVIATARAEDRALLRKLGADEIVDYRAERFEDRVHDVDLVLDLVAGETQQRSWAVLKPGGRIVSTLQPPSPEEAARHHAEGKVFFAEPRREQLAQISRLIDRGKVEVVVQETLPLAAAREAHEHLEKEHIRGKVVLVVAE